jgi:hypothetical protein
MARKRVLNGQPLWVRFPPEIEGAVRTIAENEERDLNTVVRQLVREGLESRLGIPLRKRPQAMAVPASGLDTADESV